MRAHGIWRQSLPEKPEQRTVDLDAGQLRRIDEKHFVLKKTRLGIGDNLLLDIPAKGRSGFDALGRFCSHRAEH